MTENCATVKLEPAVRDVYQRPLHDLRISVIEACNFRCPYCMPADRVPSDDVLDARQRLSFTNIERIVRAAVGLGVRKIRLTGGEPLLRKNLPDLIALLAAIPGIEDLALTTNGSLLAGQAKALKEAGLQRLTVSVDAIEPQLFHTLSGNRGQLAEVLRGIENAQRIGFKEIKINTVIQKNINENQIIPLADYFRGTGHVLRYIEYMDVGNCNAWQHNEVVPSQHVRDLIHQRWPLQALPSQYRGEVASRYRYEDGNGEIGFVSSISQPFCGDCHRARLSADGQIYTCLFARQGHDLHDALARDDNSLQQRLRQMWSGRVDQYSQNRQEIHAAATAPQQAKKIEMFFIGG